MEARKWLNGVLLAILVILQPFTTEWFIIWNVKPDILLSFFIFYSIGKNQSSPFIAGFLTGLAFDLLYSRWIGLNIIIFISAALMCRFMSKQVYRENTPLVAAFSFLSVYVLKNIYLILYLGRDFFQNILVYQEIVFFISLYSGVLCGVLSGIYLILSYIREGNLKLGKDRAR